MSPRRSPQPLGTVSLPPLSRAAANAMGSLFVPDPDSPINQHMWSKEATHGPGVSEEERQTQVPHAQTEGMRAFGEKGKRKAPNDAPNPAQGSGEDVAHPVTQNELEKYTNAKSRDRRGSKDQRQAWPQIESLNCTRCTETGQVCTKRRDYVACELCNKKQAQCSRVTIFQRWRIAQQIGVTEDRLVAIEAALAQETVSTRPSKRLKHFSGLRLRLPPPLTKNQKTTATTRKYENRKRTNPRSEAPTAALPTILVAEPTDATATETVIPTTTATTTVTLPTAEAAANLDQRNDLGGYTGDRDVLVLDEHELFHERDNDVHDIGQQDVQGGKNVVNDQIEANDANDHIEDNDVNDEIEDNDVHVEGGDGRGVELGMWFGQYLDDACKSAFYREMDVSSEFLQAHHELLQILEKAGYPNAARHECENLLARLRKQSDIAFGRAYERRPPTRGLIHPLTISEWKDEVTDKASKRLRALKDLSRIGFT